MEGARRPLQTSGGSSWRGRDAPPNLPFTRGAREARELFLPGQGDLTRWHATAGDRPSNLIALDAQRRRELFVAEREIVTRERCPNIAGSLESGGEIHRCEDASRPPRG